MNLKGNLDKLPALEVATLAGGCFWCLEAVFREVKGVTDVVSGYTGGSLVNPAYEQVSGGITGHAEAVQITFNPKIVSFRQVLDMFFNAHDPTTLNRQGADIGTQYRSAIFFHDEAQKKIASEMVNELNHSAGSRKKVVTQIIPLGPFYMAEEYHQDYFSKNPSQAYCRIVIAPKLEKYQKLKSV